MSRLLRVWMWLPSALLLAMSAGCFATVSSAAPPRYATRTTFYEALSPYGEWFDMPPYGPVWRPYRQIVGANFTPYDTGGRWVYTDYGWMFDTEWDWGWAPFHYGRWLYLGAVEGWVWVPDTVWGPAWVEWSVGGGYVGWYPLPPANAAVAVGGPYSPVWIWVGTGYFPNGLHHGHARFEPRGPPDATVLPPRPRPDGHAWYTGPSPQSITHDASAVRPRPYNPPEPLPPGVLGVPRDYRARPLPSRGTHPAEPIRPREQPSSEWGSQPRPPETHAPPPGEPAGGQRGGIFHEVPGSESHPAAGAPRSPGAPASPGAPSTTPSRPPPGGTEHGSSPPPKRSGHGGNESSPPPGRPGRSS